MAIALEHRQHLKTVGTLKTSVEISETTVTRLQKRCVFPLYVSLSVLTFNINACRSYVRNKNFGLTLDFPLLCYCAIIKDFSLVMCTTSVLCLVFL